MHTMVRPVAEDFQVARRRTRRLRVPWSAADSPDSIFPAGNCLMDHVRVTAPTSGDAGAAGCYRGLYGGDYDIRHAEIADEPVPEATLAAVDHARCSRVSAAYAGTVDGRSHVARELEVAGTVFLGPVGLWRAQNYRRQSFPATE